jgi:hypothetical protein
MPLASQVRDEVARLHMFPYSMASNVTIGTQDVIVGPAIC